MPVKQLFEIYLDGMLHITAATVLQKARERHCFISCGEQQSPSSLKIIVATCGERCVALLWARRVTLGINETPHC